MRKYGILECPQSIKLNRAKLNWAVGFLKLSYPLNTGKVVTSWDLSCCKGVELYQDSRGATFRFPKRGHPNTVSWSPTAQGACQTNQAIYQTPYHAAALRKPTFALFLWSCSRHCSRPFQGAPRYNLCICKIVSIVLQIPISTAQNTVFKLSQIRFTSSAALLAFKLASIYNQSYIKCILY